MFILSLLKHHRTDLDIHEIGSKQVERKKERKRKKKKKKSWSIFCFSSQAAYAAEGVSGLFTHRNEKSIAWNHTHQIL